MWQILAIVSLAILIFALMGSNERRITRHYLERPCAGFKWKRRFPDAANNEIHSFLDVVIEAFGFEKNLRLRFAPDDQVMEIYRTLYPGRCLKDDMELEHLVMDLEKSYRVKVVHAWHEKITLGDLFQKTRRDGTS